MSQTPGLLHVHDPAFWHTFGLQFNSSEGYSGGYLSLDCLNLILETADHAVELSNLILGVAKVFSGRACRRLHLLVLKEQDWK